VTTKNQVAPALLLLALLLSGATSAQAQLELPAASPPAQVMLRVGLTDITVEYSSPAVNKRKVFGELVPWDKPWRTGANASTKITFSRDVTFGGKPVPAGTYAVVTLPTQKGWTVLLSRELLVFSGGRPYDKKDDVARAAGATSKVPHRERLTFLFSDTTASETVLDLEWAELRVSVPIVVDTTGHTHANIKSTLDNAWRAHASAARYIADNEKDYDTALRYIDTSIGIQSTWFNNWLKADFLAKKGSYQEAHKFAQLAWDLGNKDPNFFYKSAVQQALVDWKGKK
jgi:hypothetical protein